MGIARIRIGWNIEAQNDDRAVTTVGHFLSNIKPEPPTLQLVEDLLVLLMPRDYSIAPFLVTFSSTVDRPCSAATNFCKSGVIFSETLACM